MTLPELRKIRSAHDSFRTECDGWEGAKVTAEKELAVLVRKWGLGSSDKELDLIGRLQVKAALLPAKIADMQSILAERETELRDAVHLFIHKTLSPLIQERLATTRETVRLRLKDLVTSPEIWLDQEIEKSAPVRQLVSLSLGATTDHGDRYPAAVPYAEAMMKLYSEVESFRVK